MLDGHKMKISTRLMSGTRKLPYVHFYALFSTGILSGNQLLVNSKITALKNSKEKFKMRLLKFLD
jgi:hypothetical protein